MSTCGRRGGGGVITGVVIIAVGIALLLAQIGVLRFHDAWRFWPVAFILFGVARFFDTPTPAHRVWGVTLNLIGILLLMHNFGYLRYGMDQLWPLFVVGGGLAFLFQSMAAGPDLVTAEAGGSLNGFYVFSGTKRIIKDQTFRGGHLFACFGGWDIDLTQSELEGDVAVVEATAIFGGGEMRVPPHWNVVMRGVGVFGGYQDSTLHAATPDKAVKTLIVRGAAVFGGVEVKN